MIARYVMTLPRRTALAQLKASSRSITVARTSTDGAVDAFVFLTASGKPPAAPLGGPVDVWGVVFGTHPAELLTAPTPLPFAVAYSEPVDADVDVWSIVFGKKGPEEILQAREAAAIAEDASVDVWGLVFGHGVVAAPKEEAPAV
ncbi:hypothetical protein As57867_022209, partial [Aphanomyces stellatus]